MASRATAPDGSAGDSVIQAVRRFNRFYTRQIGLLQRGLLQTPFSLTEVRLLYELAHRDGVTASELAAELSLDPGYLSRILAKFKKRGWIRRKPSPADGRQNLLTVTSEGSSTLRSLDERSNQQVAEILAAVPSTAQGELIGAMQRIEGILSPQAAAADPFLLRTHEPGDMGWIVFRHADVYWREYRYDERFESMVAAIVAEFIEKFDAKHERCWIAERNGERVGSIMLVRKSATVAKLRLFFVEPSARGMGIGRRLVEECIRFARQAGYKKIVLWTQSELKGARGIYRRAAFELVAEEKHDSWGRKGLVAETWELKL